MSKGKVNAPAPPQRRKPASVDRVARSFWSNSGFGAGARDGEPAASLPSEVTPPLARDERELSGPLLRDFSSVPSRALPPKGVVPSGSPSLLLRKVVGASPVGEVPPIVHHVLQSSGQPLDATTRAFMEPRFGGELRQGWRGIAAMPASPGDLRIGRPDDQLEHEADRVAERALQPSMSRAFGEAAPGFGNDFSHVRVHVDDEADASTRAVGALAYTVGDHIAFRAGQFSPGTSAGQRLLAHELAHVGQASTAPRPTLAREAAVDDPDANVSLGIIDNSVFGLAVEQLIGPTQWTVAREFLRGIKGGAQSMPPEQRARIDAKFANFGAREALVYAEGYGLGIGEGLWLGLKGLAEAVYMLVKLPYDVNYFLLIRFPDLAFKYGPRLVQLLSEGNGLSARLMDALSDMVKHPIETARALDALIEEVKGMALAQVHALGHGIAAKTLSLLEEPWFEYGRDIGKVVGQVLFEVILAVASDAIANVAKEAVRLAGSLTARLMKGAVEIFRGLRRLLGNLVEWLGKLAGRLTGKLAEVFGELKALFSRLGTVFEELAGESALADAGTGIHVPIRDVKGPTTMEMRAAKPPGGGGGPKVSELIPEKTHPAEGAGGAVEKPAPKSPSATEAAEKAAGEKAGRRAPEEEPLGGARAREYYDLDEAAEAALGGRATVTRRIGEIGPVKNPGVVADLRRLGYDPADFRAAQYEAVTERGTYIITVFEAQGGVYYGPHISSANF